jgi:hypothetical protein
MYFRENDKPIENFAFPFTTQSESPDGTVSTNKKFPTWVLVLIIVLFLAIIAGLFLNNNKKNKNIQQFGFRFY